ncbi:ATP synthase membrane subunit K, mitochondrial isoform X1 [Saccopteryx leptura]|uniref:ATP synthase membrane subunit K, mitochondrial isoform X1 n=1 Tax=Saccopteryx leptura TaxID=249018 RepID=UPI00339C930A
MQVRAIANRRRRLNLGDRLIACGGGGFFRRAEGYLRALKGTAGGIRAFCKIEAMAGPEADAQFQFTGIKKYFNSYTLTGRMNCVLATYGGIAMLVLYFKLRSKKTPAVKAT